MCVPTYVSVCIYMCRSIRVCVSIIASNLYAYFEYTGSRFIFVHTHVCTVCVYVYMYIYMCVYIYAYMCARAHIGTHS